jgi:hypothetical protein
LLRSRSRQRTPKLQSPTCANNKPSAIDAIQIDKKPTDLEAALAGLLAGDAATTVARFFAARHPAILGAGPEDFAAALAAALALN